MGILNSISLGGLDSHKNFGVLSRRDSSGQRVARFRLDYHDGANPIGRHIGHAGRRAR